MKYQICLLGKIRKISSLSSVEYAQRVLKVNGVFEENG